MHGIHDESETDFAFLQHNMLRAFCRFSSTFNNTLINELKAPTIKKYKQTIRNIKPDNTSQKPTLQPKAVAYSTCEQYDSLRLYKVLATRYSISPMIADDVFHVRISEENGAEAFVFTSGGFVTWGANQEQNDNLLALVRPYERNRYPLETETYDYAVEEDSLTEISAKDTLILGGNLAMDKAMLVYSAGLIRSAKLSSLEYLLDEHLDKNRIIPDILLSGKKIPIKQHFMLRNLGELFRLRAQVNLNSELLDLPEFCWSSIEMESCFQSISRSLDVRPRIAIFNKKLDYANEVAEFLRNHLHEEKLLKLEWAIVLLICVEILFSTLHYFESGHF